MLYLRMFVMMAASLYTSRIVLQVLGEEDYGIYNIIGGVVVLFSFINTALLQATQRFLNFELGKRDDDRLSRVFCMSMNSHILLSAIFLILAETLGLWFVNTQLNIPDARMTATNWAYQFSIITFIIGLIRVPYNASIIAYEKMDFFAYISVLEIILKLLLVYILFVISWDKLAFYAFFYMITPLLITFVYKWYCNKRFPITKYKPIWDKEVFRKLFSFSGWSLFGNLSNMFASQGVNILVNIFYGVILNAALGIANQVSSAVTQFVTNFQLAFNPQIVKLYAVKEYDELNKLVFWSSKLSYYLMLAISLPIILKMDVILDIWLVNVPEYTSIFTRLMLCFMLIDALNGPLWMYSQATGQIKEYQIMVGLLIFLNFPLVFFALTFNLPVWTVWGIRILVSLIVSVARYIFMKVKYQFPVHKYLRTVILTVFFVTLTVIPIPLYVSTHLHVNIWIDLLLTVGVSLFVSGFVIFYLGFSRNEKNYLTSLVKQKIRRQ